MNKTMDSRNVDRLSNMPEEVVSHILSLMPIKFAVRTSVLSKTWVDSWKSVTNLDIDDRHPFHDMHCFIKFVDRVLESCKASQIKSFRLDFSDLWVPNATISKWIEEAIRLNVVELEINTFFIDFPSPFVCKTLTKLTLVCTRHSDGWYITSPFDLPFLKTFDFKASTSANLALKIISGSPLLESLSLDVTSHMGDDDVFNFNIPTLKRLKLKTFKGIRVKKVVLNVPNLEELYVNGPLRSLVVMEDFPPMVSVTLSYPCGPEPDQSWIKLLIGMSGAKSLSLYSTSDLKNQSKSPVPRFLNLKNLEFGARNYSYSLDWPLFHQIIENSHELEHLCILEMSGSSHWPEPKDSCWIEPQSVPTCMLNNLKTIKFVNYKGRKSDIQFMTYMLENAQVLKTLEIIMCDGLSLVEDLRLNVELLKLPRASKYCDIRFIAS